MATERELTLTPIGYVATGRPPADNSNAWEKAAAEIEIDGAYAGALDGIEGFSHIWVIWWLDRSPAEEPPETLRVHPEGRPEMPLVGIFATRSPRRPNPIAMTLVRLLKRQGGRLHVQGLDAYEGTPILDLKPYLQRGDRIPEATMPHWLERLWRIHDEEREAHDGG
jgi:tRNA-Thr(GGU) m(6)t(6)A37 methyltransferase TsaA